MRKILLFLLSAVSLLCLFMVVAWGQPPPQASGGREADREAIEAVLRAQQSAWNRADVDAFLKGYWHSPELTFSELEFRFLGPDAALVLGRWHLKREKDDIGGVFSLVWQRFPDGWKIIHDHTSAVQDKPH